MPTRRSAVVFPAAARHEGQAKIGAPSSRRMAAVRVAGQRFIDHSHPTLIEIPVKSSSSKLLVELNSSGCWLPADDPSQESGDRRRLSVKVSRIAETAVGQSSTLV
jgi:hypothetical protein